MTRHVWAVKEERRYRHDWRSGFHDDPSDDGEERAEETALRALERKVRPRRRIRAGNGHPDVPLEQRTRRELLQRALELRIEGRSTMGRKALVEAIRAREEGPALPERPANAVIPEQGIRVDRPPFGK